MTFEEKIDGLKHKFSSQDFNDPFVHGTEILKAIERKFIRVKDIRDDLNYYQNKKNIWN